MKGRESPRIFGMIRYDAVLATGWGVELEGLSAFCESSGGWQEEEFDLSAFAGADIEIRFRVAWYPPGVGSAGWFIDDIELNYIDPNIPSITLLSPSNSDVTLSNYLLTWVDADANDNASISLYYETNQFQTNGILITSGISEDSAVDSFSWNVSALPQATYYVYAVITDSSDTNYSYASGSVIKVNKINGSYSNSFEDSPNDFYVQGTHLLWEKGAPTSGPGSANSGVNVWATVLNGDYAQNNVVDYLYSPYFQIQPSTNVKLEFWHYYDTESGWDLVRVQIATNYLSSFSTLNTYSGNGGAWQKLSIDLSTYTNQVVQIRFWFNTDGSANTYPGWYIDDFSIQYSELYVQEANAFSLSNIEIVFDSDLDITEATNINNYTVSGNTLTFPDYIDYNTNKVMINLVSFNLTNTFATPLIWVSTNVRSSDNKYLLSNTSITANDKIPPEFVSGYFSEKNQYLYEFF